MIDLVEVLIITDDSSERDYFRHLVNCDYYKIECLSITEGLLRFGQLQRENKKVRIVVSPSDSPKRDITGLDYILRWVPEVVILTTNEFARLATIYLPAAAFPNN